MKMPQNFKTKCTVNFRKYKSRKKVQIFGVKMAKSNKIEKMKGLIKDIKKQNVSRMCCFHRTET